MIDANDQGLSSGVSPKPERFFYLAWILLTLVCIPLAFFLNLIVLRLIILFVGDIIYVNGVRHITEDYLWIYPFVPLVGLLMGLVQYRLLRRYLPRMGAWVWATLGGWLLGMLLLALLSRLRGIERMNAATVFLVIGFSVGLGQWLLLQQRLPRAGWWIAANVAGWGLLALTKQGNSLGQFGLFTLGILPACTTAAVLALLMKQNRPQSI